MYSRRGIVQVVNFQPREAIDGGTMREDALGSFLESRNAARLVIQDAGYHGSKFRHITRLSSLIDEINHLDPGAVVLSYPSYPFFWRHKVTPYLFLSLLFAQKLRRLANRKRFGIVIDIMDLPVYQYQDLGFELEMRPEALKKFDRFIFSRADVLWVCSGSIARIINQDYDIDAFRMIVVLNGYQAQQSQPDFEDGQLKLAYAGTLNRERGLEPVFDNLLGCPGNFQINLCGLSGEWIGQKYSDPRLVYHGAITDSAARKVLSGCNLGLIPYPERGYYHLAFATKLAFYLGMGMPVLCSDVIETGEYVRNMGIGLCSPVSQFSEAVQSIVPARLLEWREQVLRVRGMFSWANIYQLALSESMRRFA